MCKRKLNEPCPCGSGLHYKKCCNSHDASVVNTGLHRLHQELIAFTMENYEDKLTEQYSLLESPLIDDETIKEIYQTGLTPWIVSFVALEGTSTIFETFYRSIQAKTSPLTLNILKEWTQTTPSVYEVMSIEKYFVQIRDVLTNGTFHIPYQNADDFIIGSLLIGMVVPFVQQHNFLFNIVKLYGRDYDYYKTLLLKYSKRDVGIIQQFPDFFAEALGGD